MLPSARVTATGWPASMPAGVVPLVARPLVARPLEVRPASAGTAVMAPAAARAAMAARVLRVFMVYSPGVKIGIQGRTLGCTQFVDIDDRIIVKPGTTNRA